MSLVLELWFITMSEVYIVEEYTWNHHQNVRVFGSEEAAEAFCKNHYGSPDRHGLYERHGYCYSIEKYEISE
jgi:hypothetical protein